MTDPVQALYAAGVLKTTLFPPSSRYHAVATTQHTDANGRTVVHLRRRFVPPPESFALLREHTVTEGDRLDNIAARHLGDPEQFWRLCDANGALRPDDLTRVPGIRIRITLPAGIQAGHG
jgi:hypothetical protein